ncbi:hypothetical protein PTSG_05519 [Salpingoeca rosetta]|uniref:NOD3 protein n=1 Tax=Salpingoeca rosetta (strain ATCC 50818 / BSB-021) TaxID=946362 RepID=F2UBG0_SALR5|nr:uncharacterized protein PTSG_05519 [Salpingoeca rosetta]EGD73826.1 hypothetical protein PTSG_05519 [Salpingoeca rosetta]|eukprot:XP_004993389.1 hypothetical protein PTSG_05519 [Salpingoeca rosetta]
MSLAEVYASCCKAQGSAEDGAVAAAMGSVVDHRLSLRGKGSLRPELGNICITDAALGPICEALKSNSSVFYLDLSYNRITDAGAATISRLLETNHSIISLSLDCNDITERGADTISKMLQVNSALKILSLRGNKIGRAGNLSLASVLQVNQTLESLDVGETDADCSAVIAYAAALAGNTALKSLNLDRLVSFTQQEEGTVHIAEMLKQNTTLTSLSMQKHGMTDFGVGRLCQALKDNATLATLDLSCNKITRDGAAELGRVLQTNTSLRSLQLNNNSLEDEGASILMKAVVGTNIDALGLAYNRLCAEGVHAVADGIRAHSRLTRLSLWGNPGLAGTTADADACRAIAGAIDRSTSALPDFESIDIQAYVVDGRALISHR